MAQLVASVSSVVLGGVAEVVGSKYLQHLSAHFDSSECIVYSFLKVQ